MQTNEKKPNPSEEIRERVRQALRDCTRRRRGDYRQSELTHISAIEPVAAIHEALEDKL